MQEHIVRRLIRQGLAGSLRELVARSGSGVASEDGGVLLYATGPPHPALFNGALRTDGADALELMDRAHRFFSRLGRSWTLWVLDGDGDLEVTARAAGLRLAAELPDMVLDRPLPAAPVPLGAAIRPVADDGDVRAAHEVLSQAYVGLGVPARVWPAVWPDVDSLAAANITTVVAELDGRPAASAMAVVTGEVGQVLNVGTCPGARRRGLGEAVTRAVVAAAFDGGATLVSLQATPPGEPLYRRLGFVEAGRSRCYVTPRRSAC